MKSKIPTFFSFDIVQTNISRITFSIFVEPSTFNQRTHKKKQKKKKRTDENKLTIKTERSSKRKTKRKKTGALCYTISFISSKVEGEKAKKIKTSQNKSFKSKITN